MIKDELMELARQPMGSGDTFMFHCTQCGNCCRNRDDILLTPFDLCRMSPALGMDVHDILQKYTIPYIGAVSRLPLVLLKMREDTGECPFLMEDCLCRIQTAKPTSCALYPLGRYAKRKNGSKAEILYFIRTNDCGERDVAQTPREWLGRSGMEESEEWFSVWQDATVAISEKIKKILLKSSGEQADVIYQFLGTMLYQNYNPKEPLVPQVKANIARAEKLIDNILQMIETGKK